MGKSIELSHSRCQYFAQIERLATQIQFEINCVILIPLAMPSRIKYLLQTQILT